MKIVYFLLGLIIGGAIVYSFIPIDIASGPTSTIKSIYFPNLNETLYLKKLNWGVTGDGQIVALSKNNIESIDKESKNEYILEGLQEIFYKQEQDTLFLFVRTKFKQPEMFDTKVIIKQMELENPAFQDLYNDVRKSVKKL